MAHDPALAEGGVTLKATEQPVDTSTAAGKAFFDTLGSLPSSRPTCSVRAMEGTVAAKERGVYKGRKPRIDSDEVRRLHEEKKLSPSVIAKRLGIVRSSVYWVLLPSDQVSSSRENRELLST